MSETRQPEVSKGRVGTSTNRCDETGWSGCFEIQINDQDRKFINEIRKQLHELMGVEQTVTPAYHRQANGSFHKNGRLLHCYEYLGQRSCGFKKRIGSDS